MEVQRSSQRHRDGCLVLLLSVTVELFTYTQRVFQQRGRAFQNKSMRLCSVVMQGVVVAVASVVGEAGMFCSCRGRAEHLDRLGSTVQYKQKCC